VAAIDSDIMGSNRSNYAYVWMRDAVLTAEVMGGREDLVGFVPACDTGQFLWQKYHPMGYRGSTWHPHAGADAFPYQMDETALLVSYAYRHQMVDDRVKGWRDLLVGSLQANGLPRPSWDLWEERFGVHFWTCATVLQAYVDAGLAGKADAMRATMEGEFARVEGRIPRRLGDSVADASVLAGCLWCESLRPAFLEPAIQMVEEFLLMATNCGGVARYEGDYYCRVREGYPGNPWVICTMWLARGYWFVGRHGEAEELLQWVEGLASLSGMLSEQYHPDTREPLSVCPLTWSHAEYLETHRLVRG
jgi:GH15 family glucan-1,4-alpha-glucosidase